MGPCVQQRANKTVQIAQSIREVMGTQSAGISDLWDGRPGEGLLVAQQLRQERGGDAEEPEACARPAVLDPAVFPVDPGCCFITRSCWPELWSYLTAFRGWAPLGSRRACVP